MVAVTALTVALLSWTTAGVQRPETAEQARAGWEALDAGRPREAADTFADALRTRPNDVGLLLGAGVAAHQLGHTDAARRYLLDALKHEPSLTTASLLLGELLYAAGDLPGAITAYEQARSYAPRHPKILVQLERWHRELSLHDRFARTLGDHFTVLFEGPAEADLARKAVEVLEAAYWRIGAMLYAYPTDVITVVLYTREQFRDITQSPGWAGGVYDGRIRVPVQGALSNVREFERVLTHEFVHALVRTLAPRGVPQWLNEGLAMNLDGTPLEPLATRVTQAEAVPALSQLERPFSALTTEGARLAYLQSAVAVRRLLAEAGAPAVVAILEDLGRGIPFAEAFERHAHMSYRAFAEKVSAR